MVASAHPQPILTFIILVMAVLIFPILSHCLLLKFQNPIIMRNGNGRFDPTRVTQLSSSPRAFIYKGFLSDGECDHLINLAKGRLEKSMVVDNDSGKSVASQVRTRSGAFLSYAEDEIVAVIETRIAAWTFLPFENEESIHILRYELGQNYEPHFDYFHDKHNLKFGGQRAATVLMYLSDVKKGFPKAEGGLQQQKGNDLSDCAKQGYAVKPQKGDALLFFSLHPNATTDEKSLHGSCPVIEGEKWSATKWIHVRSFLKAETCMDDNDNCPQWAAMGECEENPKYMVGENNTGGHCKKSCGLCSS